MFNSYFNRPCSQRKRCLRNGAGTGKRNGWALNAAAHGGGNVSSVLVTPTDAGVGGLKIKRSAVAPLPSVTTAVEDLGVAGGLCGGGASPTRKQRTRGAARGHEPGRPLTAPAVFHPP